MMKHAYRIMILMAGSAFLLGWMVKHSEPSSNIGLRYIRQAERIEHGLWRDGLARGIAQDIRDLILTDCVLGETPLVMSVWRTSIGNNVRRAGSSFLPRPYCHFALQHGPALNIAHSFFASSQSHLARVGTWAISSASAELQTGAQSQLSFCYFAFLNL